MSQLTTCRGFFLAALLALTWYGVTRPCRSAPRMDGATTQSTQTERDAKASWRATFNAWQSAYDGKDYERGKSILSKALTKIDGSTTLQQYLPETLTDLIMTCYANHKYAEAVPFYERSLKFIKENYGTKSPEYVSAHANYNALLQKLNSQTTKTETPVTTKPHKEPGVIAATSAPDPWTSPFKKESGLPKRSPWQMGKEPSAGAAPFGGTQSGATPLGTTQSNAPVMELSEENFEDQVLRSDKPVLVDFFAVWCGPCKAMSPVVDELASTYAGKIKVFRVDIDKCPALAKSYDVHSIPTFITFKYGSQTSTRKGSCSRDQMTAFVDASVK